MQTYFINFLLVVLAFASMEGVAWFTHKYIMHGWLWILHRDHHQKNHRIVMERNDFFFLFFAIPGIVGLYYGVTHAFHYTFWLGLGVTLYGAAYFMVHDIFIHRRIRLFRNSKNLYLTALRRAHKVHHKHLDREQGECFGMLVVPRRFFREAASRRA